MELNKLCNVLIKFEIIPEDIIADGDQDKQSIDITVDLEVCDSTSSLGFPPTKAVKRPKKVEIRNIID